MPKNPPRYPNRFYMALSDQIATNVMRPIMEPILVQGVSSLSDFHEQTMAQIQATIPLNTFREWVETLGWMPLFEKVSNIKIVPTEPTPEEIEEVSNNFVKDPPTGLGDPVSAQDSIPPMGASVLSDAALNA